MIERLLVIGGFLCYCLILSFWGVERDRRAWRVLAAFGSLEFCLQLSFPDGFGSDWGPAIDCSKEIAVIWALYLFAWGRIAIWMMGIVALFFAAHLCLYLDIETGSNLIYDRYEITIRGLIVVLAALGTNGIAHAAKGIRDGLRSWNRSSSRGFQLDIPRSYGQKQDREDKKASR